MFGGRLTSRGDRTAETTILRFGEVVDTVHALPLAVQDYNLWRMKLCNC